MKVYGTPQHMLGLPSQKEDMTEPKTKYEGFSDIHVMRDYVPPNRVILDVFTVKEVESFQRDEFIDGCTWNLSTPMEVERIYFVTALRNDDYVAGLIEQRDGLNEKYSNLITESSEQKKEFSVLESRLKNAESNYELASKDRDELRGKARDLVKEKEELIDQLGRLTEHFGKAQINEILKSDDE